MMNITYGKAICYSGYRKNQSPIYKKYPTYNQVLEDLKIIEKDFDYIRMYDAGQHCKITLEVIKKEQINLKVLLGIDLLGEISNPNCTWGGTYTNKQLANNIAYNQKQLNDIIDLANQYQDIVLGVSAGNESVPHWNENLVHPSRVLYFVKQLKEFTNVPVTYCDSYHEWQTVLQDVAEEVDVISIHSYPVWQSMGVNQGIDQTIQAFNSTKAMYPNKQIIITETGWPTRSNGGQIKQDIANETNQLIYNKVIDEWAQKNQVTTFFFEAFDEPWKGSDNQNEPEKHWGYYYETRKPKRIMESK